MEKNEDPYVVWSKALVDRFFGLHMENQRARLIIDKEILDSDFPHLGGYNGFVSAVNSGPGFIGQNYEGTKFHGHAMALYKQWRFPVKSRYGSCFSLPDDAPLYLPHLAALCLAWSIDSDEENLAAQAFYERLAIIIPDHGLSTLKLKEWTKLWDGLKSWSNELNGKRGYFNPEALGFRYVGIPLSQVLITARKISKLPELFFSTGLADVWKTGFEDHQYIRKILIQNESRSRSALGGMLFNQIKSEKSNIGDSVILRILEFLSQSHFRSWNPPSLINSESINTNRINDQSQQSIKNSIKISLVLESHPSTSSWRCCFGILGVDPPDNSSNDDNWHLKKVDERLGGLYLAVNHSKPTEFIDAKTANKSLDTGFLITFNPNPGRDEEETTLKLAPKKIRVFHENGWLGQRLIEEDSFPEEGGCFLFVSQDSLKEFISWTQDFKSLGGCVNNYTLQGLPRGSELFHLSKIEVAGNDLIARFPEKSLAHKRSKKILYLRGGSQLHGTGNQNLYLPYDPPDVVLVAPSSVRIEVCGANFVEDTPESAWTVPQGLNGYQQRQFRLDLQSEATHVRICALSEDPDWIPVVETFAIGRETTLGADFSNYDSIRFNKFGFRTKLKGILGGKLDAPSSGKYINSSNWCFTDGNLDLGEEASPACINHSSWMLLESIGQVTRLTAQEFRRRCERILNWWPRYAWAEVRWLRALCHIEVERDNRGRIAYVYSVNPQAYLLPQKKCGRWLVCITGCLTQITLQDLFKQCSKSGIEVYFKDRENPFLPPRLLFTSNSLPDIKGAMEKVGIQFLVDTVNPIPLSAQLAEWAGSLADWESDILWLDGPAPQGDAHFNPYRFRVSQNEEFHCPCRLISIVDSLSKQHRWNILSHNKIDKKLLDIVPRHAFLTDDAWGKWFSMSIIASDFPDQNDKDNPLTPIPLHSKMGFVDIPASLVFPTMLSRAILTSTGMPPKILEGGSDFYLTSDSPFLPCEIESYSGACLRYENAHPKIFKIVLEKLNAKLLEKNL